MVPVDGGGRFQMGCVSGVRCLFNEPVHEVVIKRPFAMSVYEITRGEFRRFVEHTNYVTDAERPDIKWPIGKKPIPQVLRDRLGRSKRSCLGWSTGDMQAHPEDPRPEQIRLWTWRQPGLVQTDQRPVVCISWADAMEYVKWLGAETGRPYRLPSEAEWEYVARAFPLPPEEYEGSPSWCDRDSLEPSPINFLGRQLIGGTRPNAFGLCHIGSGVSEWTGDCWNRTFRGAPLDGSAWTAGRCEGRVLRDIIIVRGPPLHEIRGRGLIHTTRNHVGIRIAASPID